MVQRVLRLWPPGVSVQLTLWYGSIFTALFLLCGMVFYLNLKSSLTTNFDTMLHLRMSQIASSVSQNNGGITLHDKTGELAGLITGDAFDQTEAHTTRGGSYEDPNFDVDLDALVRILGPGGKVLYTTPSFQAITAPASSVSQPLHDQPWIGTVRAHNGQEVRLYSAPLQDDGRVYGVVQVGASLSPLKHTLRSVVLEMLMIAPLALLLSIAGSYWLAKRAFLPIERLRRTAATIKAGDLHQRVPVPRASDEVQHLALTFNEMIDALEQTFTRQRRFTADASHELRTPIAAIRSMTDVALAQDSTREECLSVLRGVNRETQRLTHLIHDLFTLARADEGDVGFEQEAVGLDRLARDVATVMEPLAIEREIALEVETCEAVLVVGDEARLIQLLMNLLSNALTYTSAGGKVTLKVAATGSDACLTVSDTGVGIAPEHIAHIFERFYRVDTARSHATGGIGLGLSIAEWIVRMHHGTIGVESQPGVGSTFTVQLPLDKTSGS
jgi:two-component system OmpR family sensor kinase